VNSEYPKPNAKDAKVPQRAQKEQPISEGDCSHAVIGAAVEVQRLLGVGLLESAYAGALAAELNLRGLRFQREVAITGKYKGVDIGVLFRADFIVEDSVILEIKAVEGVADAHRAQILSYLRLSGHKIGLLINFHEFPVARGVHRLVNKL
jgi:GxxExxY protein